MSFYCKSAEQYHSSGRLTAQGKVATTKMLCVQDLGFQVWIMGVLSGCALGVSFVLAVAYLCVTIFSGASRHYRFISTPAAYVLEPLLLIVMP